MWLLNEGPEATGEVDSVYVSPQSSGPQILRATRTSQSCSANSLEPQQCPPVDLASGLASRWWFLPPSFACWNKQPCGPGQPASFAGKNSARGFAFRNLPFFLLFPEAGLGCFLNRHFWGCNSFCSNKCFYSLLQPSPPLEG